MGDDKGKLAFCAACLLTGYIAPWVLIASAAIISVLPLGEAWQETSAWLMAIGFALLCGSYFAARLFNRIVYDQEK